MKLKPSHRQQQRLEVKEKNRTNKILEGCEESSLPGYKRFDSSIVIQDSKSKYSEVAECKPQVSSLDSSKYFQSPLKTSRSISIYHQQYQCEGSHECIVKSPSRTFAATMSSKREQVTALKSEENKFGRIARRRLTCLRVRHLSIISFISAALLSATLIHTQSVADSTTLDAASTLLQQSEPKFTTVAPIQLSEKTTVVDSSSSYQTTTSPSVVVTTLDPDDPHSEGINNGANATVKPKPVNFTLVDEVFESVLSDEELVETWKRMDKTLQNGIKSILKMIFPQIVSLSQDAKVSGDCSGGILKWILSLRNLRSWAIKMLDASGKPTSGIFEGSLSMLGNYHQCLNIRAPDEDEIEITDQFEEYFRGQYCVLHLKPWMPVKPSFYLLNSTLDSLIRKDYKYYEKTLYDELAEIAISFNFLDIRMDLCVPSSCTIADIQRVAELLSKKFEMRAKVMRCDMTPKDASRFSNVDHSTWTWLSIPVVLSSISIVCTIISWFLHKSDTDVHEDRASVDFKEVVNRRIRPDSDCGEDKESRKRKEPKSQLLVDIVDSLSIINAFQYLFSSHNKRSISHTTSSSVSSIGEQDYECNDDRRTGTQNASIGCRLKPLPLYGLRSIFVFWFIIIQMTMELKYQYLRESLNLRNMIISNWPFQLLVNSTIIFESLIIITAFIYGYISIEYSLKDITKYVIDKYIRLILSIVTVVAITIATPLLDLDSPLWRNFVEEQSIVCKSTGYINLSFLQNFISYDKICLPHTWLFCVELQLIAIFIPLILLLKKTFISTEDFLITGKSLVDSNGRNSQVQPNVLLIASSRIMQSKAGILSFILIIVGFALKFYTVYTNQLPPSWFYTLPDTNQRNYYFGIYLTKTWTHMSVFLIGLLAGHLYRTIVQLRHIDLLDVHDKSHSRRTNHQKCPSPSTSISTITYNLESQHPINCELSINPTITDPRDAQNEISTTDSTSSVAKTSDSYRERPVEEPNHRRSKLVKTILQSSAIVCMLAVIFSTYSWSTKQIPPPLISALYDVSSRLVWSLALSGLMIQLCLPNRSTNKYSRISMARILGHPLSVTLGRLSFLAYLVSPYVNTFVLAVEEQSMYPSLMIMFHVVLGNIVITFIIAFILSIVIEQPMRRMMDRFLTDKKLV